MKKNIDQIIEDALKIEPKFNLGADFKDRVTKMIRKKERKIQRKLYLLISIGVIMIFGAGIALVQYFGNIEALYQFDQLVPLAVIVGGLVAIIQYLDKRLVKDKSFKQLA